ncbi:MAG: rhodanese-like domain-containing protein, partial [Bdellovibrionota bacterium]
SKLIPLGDVPVRAPVVLAKDSEIVVYCLHGVRSLNALMAMRQQGFENVRSLDGGIDAWAEVCDPDMVRY